MLCHASLMSMPRPFRFRKKTSHCVAHSTGLIHDLTFAATSWNSSPLRTLSGEMHQRCGVNPGTTHHCTRRVISWNISPLDLKTSMVMPSPGIPHHPGTAHLWRYPQATFESPRYVIASA